MKLFECKESSNYKIFFLYCCIGALITSFYISIALNSILVVLAVLFSLSRPYTSVKLYTANRSNVVLLILFLILLFSLTYSSNINKGLARVVTYVPIVIVPLGLAYLKFFSGQRIKSLMYLHLLACTIACVYCISAAIDSTGLLDESYKNKVAPELYPAYFIHRLTYHQLSGHINLHAVYFSFFIALAMFFIINELSISEYKNRTLLISVLIFLSIVLILLKSAVINFAFYSFLLFFLYRRYTFKSISQQLLFLLLSFYTAVITYYLFALKSADGFNQNSYLFEDAQLNLKLLKAAILGASIGVVLVLFKLIFAKRHLLIISGIAISSVIYLGVKYFIPKNNSDETLMNNVNARYESWKSALQIVKQHPLLGVGIGDSQQELLKKYKESNFTVGLQNNFNVHNQYLELWIVGGIIAFVCFILFIVLESQQAWLSDNYLLLFLLYLFSVFCFTESVLLGQLGRIFFLLFLCITRNYPLKKQRDHN
jgi:O-antigen ligase